MFNRVLALSSKKKLRNYRKYTRKKLATTMMLGRAFQFKEKIKTLTINQVCALELNEKIRKL